MIGLVVRNCLIAFVIRSHHIFVLVFRTLVRVLVLQTATCEQMLRKIKFQIRMRDLDVLQRQLSHAGSPFLAREVFGTRSQPVCSIFNIAKKPLDIAMFDVVGDEVAPHKVYGERVTEMLAEAVIAQVVFFVEFKSSGKLYSLSCRVEDDDPVLVLIQKILMS